MKIDWTILFFFLLFLIVLITSAKAGLIATETNTRVIDIINQTGIDVNISYQFHEVNDTHWNASFCIDPDTVFNPVAYPLANLTAGIGFETPLTIRYNATSKCGWFYLIFKNGFKAGEMAKFGVNSTIIQSTMGDSSPFISATRAICRTTNKIHVVAVNGSQVDYWNSSDGTTWGFMRLDGSANTDDPSASALVSIACSGSDVFVAWVDSDTRPDLDYMNSSDEGLTWSPYVSNSAPILVDGTGSGAYVIQTGGCAYGNGKNVYCAYHWDGGTPEDIWVVNASNYGGNLPTITQKDLGIDIGTTASPPAIFVNMSGTTEEVYTAFYWNSKLYTNVSVNSGTTWSGVSISTTGYNGELSNIVLNKTLYVILRTADYASPLIWNSTDRGTSWGSGVQLGDGNMGFSPSLATNNNNNLYAFWGEGNAGTEITDVNLRIFNASGGWGAMVNWQNVNSNISTKPNCNWLNSTGHRIECVFINQSKVVSGVIDLRYDYIQIASAGTLTSQPVYDSFTYSELMTTAMNWGRILYDTSTYAELQLRNLTLTRYFYDYKTYSEWLVTSALHPRTFYDSMTYAELQTKVSTFPRVLYDTATYAEYVVKNSTFIRRLYDYGTYAENIIRMSILYRVFYESVSYAENLITGNVYFRILFDTATYSELATRGLVLLRDIYDSVVYYEYVVVSGGAMTYVIYLYDTAVYAESVLRRWILTIVLYDSVSYFEYLYTNWQMFYANVTAFVLPYIPKVEDIRYNIIDVAPVGLIVVVGGMWWWKNKNGKKGQEEEL